MRRTTAQRARRIHKRLMRFGAIQVRLWHQWLLTYPLHPRRGYGTRGDLIAVYQGPIPLEWIEADISIYE